MRKNQKGFSAIEILLVIVVISLLGVGGWYVYHKSSTKKPVSAASTSKTGKYATFSGQITSINNGCEADGVCSITVNDYSFIITGGGLSTTSADNIYGNLGQNGGNARFTLGQTVKVRALPIKNGSGFTLQGCSECYVK